MALLSSRPMPDSPEAPLPSSPPSTLPLFYDAPSPAPAASTQTDDPSTTQLPHDDPALEIPPIPRDAQILPLSAAHIPSLRRLLTSLLPVRYPDAFYKGLIANEGGLWLTHVVQWAPSHTATPSSSSSSSSSVAVVGAMCARLEPHVPPSPSPPPPGGEGAGVGAGAGAAGAPGATIEYDLYLSHLAVLAPYRRFNLASALLAHTLDAARAAVREMSGSSTTNPTANTKPDPAASATAAAAANAGPRTRLRSVYAHVWERNEEALAWYARRGFEVEEELVPGYYRRLKPGGARVVRREVG